MPSYGRPGGACNSDDPLDNIRQFFQSLDFRWIYWAVMIALAAAAGFTCFYTVEPDEEVVVLRLGKYRETTGPGLHFKLPFGIDRAIKVKTKVVLQEEFGFRSQGAAGSRTASS